ncbi:MAG: acyl-CoA desaturase [Cyclobacteriaceae bacterium]|nr:acyl-CoA desaturase [Cyclobacteriaceae bacterium]
MAHFSTLKFPSNRSDFFTTLNKRVNEYFKSNDISRHANTQMRIKTIFMFSLYFAPYALILGGVFSSIWVMYLLWAIMGLGMAGIGLSIMHDANHGAYSTKPWVNNLLGFSMNLVGGSAFNWKVQHNVLHHTYTNVHEADEDISPRGVLRMCPSSDWKFMHRFQHLYAWFLYGLMTFMWIVVKDYARITHYHKEGLVKKQKADIRTEWAILIATKAFNLFYVVILPIILLPVAWWHILIGFFIMHYVAGFILAIIFQPAHVIDGTEFPLPDDNGQLENSWAIHQLLTTTNFANNSTFFSWYVGGLNFQVEHHLFPNVCHVHYKKISKIVKETAKEFGLPYKSQPTFAHAVWHHAKLLKELGKPPVHMTA